MGLPVGLGCEMVAAMLFPRFTRMMRPTLLACLLLAPCAGAADGGSFTLYWPTDAGREMPSWLGAPEITESSLGTLGIPIQPESDAALAVTVYFVEPADGFLRVLWVTPEQETMVSANLCEGVGGAHQRTVYLSQALLKSAGSLVLQASADAVPVFAVRFEWMKSQTLLVAEGGDEPSVSLSGGRLFDNREIAGTAYLPPSGGWNEDVVTTALSDRVESIVEGAEFIVALDAVPDQARLEMRIAGADLQQPVLVWVNGTYAGYLQIEVPDLSDEGYYLDGSGSDRFAGWRKAGVFLVRGLWRIGDNSVQLGHLVAPAAAPSAKDMLLQLRYSGANDATALWKQDGETLGDAPDFMVPETGSAVPQFRFE